MAVENGWGQGAVNNTNDYGKAKANSTNGFGKIYETSNAGLTNIIGGTGAVLAQVNNVYSMAFDGTNDYVHVNSFPFDGLTSLSISFWYNLNSISTDQAVIAKWTESPRSILLYHDAPNGWRILIDGVAGLQSTHVATINTWQHLAVTYESGVATKIYLNGVGQSTTSGAGAVPTSTNFNIGRDALSGSLSRYLNGKLDEVAIFNTALTEQEIQSIYNATETGKTADLNDLTTPPVKWYRMGD